MFSFVEIIHTKTRRETDLAKHHPRCYFATDALQEMQSTAIRKTLKCCGFALKSGVRNGQSAIQIITRVGGAATMLKILHILGSTHIGGIEKLVLDLSVTQKQDTSLDVGIFFMRTREGDYEELYRRTGLHIFSAGLTSGYDVTLGKYVQAYRIFLQYEILHIHSFSPFMALTAVLSGRRLIFTRHGVSGRGRRRRMLVDPVKSWLLKIFLNHFVDFITFNSLFTERETKHRYGLVQASTNVIYNGIPFEDDTELDTCVDREIAARLDGKLVVGTTSRFVGFKRIDRLIKAFSQFRQGKNTILLLVGDGPLREDLEQIVRDRNLCGEVVFTGFRTDVRSFQRVMDVCVFPSQEETFGLAAVEALSLGKPVIVFRDGGGIIEVVGGYSQDDVVESIRDLVERLNYYYENRLKVDATREDRITYAKTFDIQVMASQFKSLYLNVAPCVE